MTAATVDLDAVRARLAEIVSSGVVADIGTREPGRCGIDAAICWAEGAAHGDTPSTVAPADLGYLRQIADGAWPSPQARADALLPLALAAVGTATANRKAWAEAVTRGTAARVLPLVLDAAADHHHNPRTATEMRSAADLLRARHILRGIEAALSFSGRSCTFVNSSAHTAQRAAGAANAAVMWRDTTQAGRVACFGAWIVDPATVLREAAAVALDAYRAEGRLTTSIAA